MLIFIVGFFLNDTLICRAAAAVPEESNFTNLIGCVRFAGEDEFIDKEYEGTSVRKITDNSYNTAYYNVADYFQTVSSGKLRMNSVYLFDGSNIWNIPSVPCMACGKSANWEKGGSPSFSTPMRAMLSPL